MNAHYLTIRNVPPDLSKALEREKRRRGVSLNQAVIDLLEAGLGVREQRSNGLTRLAGTWSAAQHREFLKNIESFSEIDSELWK